MNKTMFLRPDAIPHPNHISKKVAQKWAARIAPPGEARHLLTELLQCLGIQPDITGAERAILHFIPYAPYQVPQACAAVRNEAKRLLREYILSAGSECRDTSKNRLIDFHLEFFAARMYPQLAAPLHIGVVGKYEQVVTDKKTFKEIDFAINNFLSPIRVVLPNLHPGDLPDIGFFETLERELEQKQIANLEAALRRVIAPLKKQRKTNGTYLYPQKSVENIAKRFANALLDRSRHRKYFTREAGTRQSGEHTIAPQKSVSPNKYRSSRSVVWSTGDLSFLQKLDAVEPEPVDPYSKAKDTEDTGKQRNQRLSFLDQTLGYPEKISFRVLGLLYLIMDQHTFLADPLNRLAAQLVFDHLLHYRRGPEFTAALRLGEKSQVTRGPVLALSEGVIYTLPCHYFGKNEAEINAKGLTHTLEDPARYAAWQASLAGREYGDLVSGLPLTALHT